MKIKRPNGELEQRVAARASELAVANEELRKEIVERQRAEADLRRQTEILQKIFDHIPVMISFLDADGRLKLVNRAWERTRGWSLAEAQARNLDIVAEMYPDPQEQRRVREFIAAATGDWADFKNRTPDGRVLHTTWATVRLSDGTRINIGQDITERKRAEQQLRSTSEQLRALTASLSSAREEESARLSREIHDELGSALTSLRWDLESLDRRMAEAGPAPPLRDWRAQLESMMRLTETTISAMRRISAELRPSVLDDLGLAEALEWQAQQFQAHAGINCRYDSAVSDLELSQAQTIAVFRICQEALTNILRHAQATQVEIKLRREAGELIITISDNGRSITEAEKANQRSLGLLGMRERARLIGGQVEIDGGTGQGTVVTVRVPN